MRVLRQYENNDEFKQAIIFYTRAKRFNHGIRLAKEHGFENELMTLALESTKELKIDAAKYFENRELFDKAVLLYQKGILIPESRKRDFTQSTA